MRCKNAHFFLFLFYYIFSYHPLHYIINQKMLQILIEQHRDYSSLPSWNIFFKWCISLIFPQILKQNHFLFYVKYNHFLLSNVLINSFISSWENFTTPRKIFIQNFQRFGILRKMLSWIFTNQYLSVVLLTWFAWIALFINQFVTEKWNQHARKR